MWAESMKAIGSAFEMGIVASRTFRGEISVLPLGKIQVGFANTVADGEVKVLRNEQLIAADRDNRIMIVINRSETPMRVKQFDREAILQLGEMVVLAMDSPSECSTPRSGASNVIMIPREMINQPGQMLERYASIRLETDYGAQELLSTHVRDLLAINEQIDEEIEIAAGDYIICLVSSILALPGMRKFKPKAGNDTARLISVRKLIAKHYREPNYSPAALGKDLQISSRSIQILLREHGTTFTAELTRVRLEAAYATLKSPQTKQTISEIALRCGFTELSTFYRAFRKHYGATPKQMRNGRTPY